MPLYEYECFVCGHRFEIIHRVDAEPPKACPECGGAVHRLLGTPALQFKGSGWYITDYGSGRSRGSTSNGNGNGASGGSSDQGTKPAGPPSSGDGDD